MGAVSVLKLKTGVIGDMRMTQAIVTLSSTYTAGGDTLTPKQLGLTKIIGLFAQTISELGAAPAGVKVVKPKPQADGSYLVKVMVMTTGAEITAAPTDQTAINDLAVIAFGR